MVKPILKTFVIFIMLLVPTIILLIYYSIRGDVSQRVSVAFFTLRR